MREQAIELLRLSLLILFMWYGLETLKEYKNL